MKKNTLTLLFVIFSCYYINGQSSKEVLFVDDLKQEAREQLKQILSTYDLEDWIFTNTIQIEHGVDAHSHPVLTMNTDHLDDDEAQLVVFLHENAHWYVADDDKDSAENAAIEELKKLYPNPPNPKQRNLYHHIMVNWIEYDAVIELLGKEKALALLEDDFEFVKKKYGGDLAANYIWYNKKAVENAQEVGEIMVKYGFNINPDKGIIIK